MWLNPGGWSAHGGAAARPTGADHHAGMKKPPDGEVRGLPDFRGCSIRRTVYCEVLPDEDDIEPLVELDASDGAIELLALASAGAAAEASAAELLVSAAELALWQAPSDSARTLAAPISRDLVVELVTGRTSGGGMPPENERVRPAFPKK